MTTTVSIERLRCSLVDRRDRHNGLGVLVGSPSGEAMSETLAAGRRTTKATCRKCNRTIHVIGNVELDPELIQVVEFEKRSPQLIHARRLHSELCESYQQATKKAELHVERQLWNARNAQNPPRTARRAPSGRREPGQ